MSDVTQHGKEAKITILHERMENMITMLDSIDPEKAGVEDIDLIISMLDEIEEKCQQYRREMNGE
ncbi:SE1561 family protein [Evansella sp. AB-rgal1]|uniref:SE1561 family protein n=1 Tax=Evansella sp. AB-rgal1 TaxID=3242696 RepID=UPI00359CFC52